ncbi:MAG: YbhB/YbcL family Raf kinase inhibitor-like protein [Defluviitaleaceae bacterium]|nr:YbhB/YbcL family Raf kinase inhibitor-like protein [Defluviitaleaceae bacterium]
MKELKFECSGLTEGGVFPLEYTGRGADKSPAFILHNLSPEARTIAIIMEDLDVSIPIFGTLAHWLIWNIPARSKIQGHIPAGEVIPDLGNAMQGIGFGKNRYAGPKPPKGNRHTYKFTLYVLDSEISLKSNSKKRHLLAAIKPHIIQKGEITGVFE